jgi:hypothetical protein
MDQEPIHSIVAEIARYLPDYSWPLLALQALLTLIAAGMGAFFAEYLRTRGRNLATKADFENLQDQLRANTTAVETIKAEAGWAKREWTLVRRTKLEELMLKVSPLGQLQIISDLYFPELAIQVGKFSIACREQIQAGIKLRQSLLNAREDKEARDKAYELYRAEYNHAAILALAQELRKSARELLLSRIMNLPPSP